MSLDIDYPALTALLDRYFRRAGDGAGDDAAVTAFLGAAGDTDREAVLSDIRGLLEASPDPYELRSYLMEHRFEMLPGGAEEWLRHLEGLLERSF